MPVVSCPKCPTKLRVPDGATGNTKCPKCNTVFPVGAKAAAFEVVDETPASPPPRPASPPPRPAASPPPPAKSEFDFDDDAPKKKRRRDDDEDDDRPSKRRRDDDEDDDDRPRSRRRRDDDDDERPRRKKGGRRRAADYDDDDDDENWRSSNKKGAFGAARTGVLLLNISFWLYFAALALISLCIFLAWVGAFDGSSSSSSRSSRSYDDDDFGSGGGGETLVKLLGIMGMSNWVVALVGFGFCIAGPARARGMAITATALAGAHLLLAGITFNNLGGGLIGRFSGGLGGGTWILWTSMMPFLDAFLPALIYGRGMPSELVFAFLAGVCEVLRLVFAMLMVKQLAIAARDDDSAQKSQFGMVSACIIAGVSMAFVLLVVVLLDAGITKSIKALQNILMATFLLVYMGFTAMTVLPALATGGARSSLAYRARRG